MTLYAIEASGGEYDEVWTRVLSIWSTEALAKAEIERIQKRRDEARKVKEPKIDYRKPDAHKKWAEWRSKTYWLTESVDFYVIEFELDKINTDHG
jgi:hypothetical protein